MSVLATLLLGAVVVGCGGDEGKVSVDGLHDKAKSAPSGSSCPVPYDVGAAARKAKAKGTAKALHGKDGISARTPEDADTGTPIAKTNGSVIDCGYQLGPDRIRTTTVGVQRGKAIDLVLPDVMRNAGMGTQQVGRYRAAVTEATPGVATVTPSRNVATVRLPVDGDGDAALVVSAGANGHAPAHIDAARLRTLAEKLAVQAEAAKG